MTTLIRAISVPDASMEIIAVFGSITLFQSPAVFGHALVNACPRHVADKIVLLGQSRLFDQTGRAGISSRCLKTVLDEDFSNLPVLVKHRNIFIDSST
ncbi:hypothetical protein Brsp02_04315 [Brucella sp. NBRC 113783]